MSNEDTVRAVLAHITAGEYEQLATYVTEDLRFELPFAAPPIPDHFDGRAVWDGMQRQTFKMFTSFRNEPRAFWFWVVTDNLRISAENAMEVARELLQ